MPHGDDKTFIRLRSGRKFWPLDPRPEDIDVRDIAYGLAGQFRYAGHSRLTVAQHSVVGSRFVKTGNELPFLFHDSAEGLGLNDLARPVKHNKCFAFYIRFEDEILKAAAKKFGFLYPFSKDVHTIDDHLGYTERILIIWPEIATSRKGLTLKLNADDVRVWSPEEAEERFLRRYEELTGEKVTPSVVHTKLGPVSRDPELDRVLADSPARAAGLLDRAEHDAEPSRPPNSFTTSEYMRENSLSDRGARNAVQRLAAAGKVRPVLLVVKQSNGKNMKTMGWQLVPDAVPGTVSSTKSK